jgi:flagellar motor switch protein FliN/FliY
MSDDLVQRDLSNTIQGAEEMSEDFSQDVEEQEDMVSQGVLMNKRSTDLRSEELGLLLDIHVLLAIEIGTKQMKVNELMKLNRGSVIELDKAAGEPLDIKANGSLIARGEVVISNGKYGIRLTEVVNKSDRTKSV